MSSPFQPIPNDRQSSQLPAAQIMLTVEEWNIRWTGSADDDIPLVQRVFATRRLAKHRAVVEAKLAAGLKGQVAAYKRCTSCSRNGSAMHLSGVGGCAMWVGKDRPSSPDRLFHSRMSEA